MLKRLVAVSATLACLSLAACGNEADGDETAADPSTSSSSETTSETPSETPSESSSESEAPAAGACEYVEDGSTAAKPVDLPPSEPTVSGEVKIVFKTTLGDIPATLDADATPCTVNSFVSLAEQGFFDDSPCPRMATDPAFGILQCGDPSGTGSGGPGYSFADELTGQETYPAGTLAMANAGPDTNGSQFFFVFNDSPGLTANYNVFGTVDPAGLKLLTTAAKKGDDGSHPAGGGVPNAGPIDIQSVTIG
ncbi:peptidylprolyl isomerase [Nocardioides currus]|uniref:Peptidyl-prolyl cis-trans isomerase n=1 Tax=Nocardioides currus TaxID=2133958 RepID=A0A2R7YTT9_9ACTN|nr:peptidylprolyl isomerase [Nocardioides currus]PUA79269.1 peptidylprolyl isomerase [Nocardioides currus]